MITVHSNTRTVGYLPSLKTIVQHLRATNATPSSLNPTLLTITTGQLTTSISIQTQTSECHHQQIFKRCLTLPSQPLHLISLFILPGAIGLVTNTSSSTTNSTTDSGASIEYNSEDVPSILSSIKNKPHGTVECMYSECDNTESANSKWHDWMINWCRTRKRTTLRGHYFSVYSNSTLFETDDRFWGAFTFVGAIFTTAPTNSQAIQNYMTN